MEAAVSREALPAEIKPHGRSFATGQSNSAGFGFTRINQDSYQQMIALTEDLTA
jgi:hypothetical protein